MKRKVDCCVNNVYLQDHVRLQLQRSDTILGNKSINSVTGKIKKEFLLVFCNFILKCALADIILLCLLLTFKNTILAIKVHFIFYDFISKCAFSKLVI